MLRESAPMALSVPISRVRSVTDTSMMFISAMDDPRMVMRPMIKAATLSLPSIPSMWSRMDWLLRTMKLSSCEGRSPRTMRIVTSTLSVNSASAAVSPSGGTTDTVNEVKDG